MASLASKLNHHDQQIHQVCAFNHTQIPYSGRSVQMIWFSNPFLIGEPCSTLSSFILIVYSLFILGDMKPLSNSFQVTLCGCQGVSTLQGNKLESYLPKDHITFVLISLYLNSEYCMYETPTLG